MKQKTEMERLRSDRDNDTEWLVKYKSIVDGLQQIAEIMFDTCLDDGSEWTAMYGGLNTLSKLMREDIEGRKEDNNG